MGYFGIGANTFITHDQPSYLVGSRCEVVVGMLNRFRNRLGQPIEMSYTIQ